VYRIGPDTFCKLSQLLGSREVKTLKYIQRNCEHEVLGLVNWPARQMDRAEEVIGRWCDGKVPIDVELVYAERDSKL
jgi:hypothetical protein